MKTVSNEEFKNNFKKLVGKNENVYGKICTVKSVNAEKLTITATPIDTSPDYLNVMLAISSASSNVLIPAVGTKVIIQFLDTQTAYVSLIDNVEKYISKTHDSNAEEQLSVKQIHIDFADGIKDIMNQMTFNTSQGPTTAGILPPAAIDLNTLVTEYKNNLDNFYD